MATAGLFAEVSSENEKLNGAAGAAGTVKDAADADADANGLSFGIDGGAAADVELSAAANGFAVAAGFNLPRKSFDIAGAARGERL